MFLECRGARIGFDIESLQLVPSGPALVQRRTVLILHGGDRQTFSGLRERFQVVHVHLEPRDAAALAQSVEVLCNKLELDRVLLIGVGKAAAVASLLATRAPALVSKVLIVESGKLGTQPEAFFD
jgi:pimeloyl-ACP methyl ester carboxylesterase